MSTECVCDRFVSGPLNANELQLPTQWAELQECSSNYLPKMSETDLPFMFKLESDKDWETKKKWQHVECNRTPLNG